MITKICKKCNIEQPLENFHKKSALKSGIANECKTCKNKRAKFQRLENKDKVNAYYRNYYQNYKTKEKTVVETLICATCSTEKPVSEFHKGSGTKSGYKHSCKTCRNEDGKEYRERNPGKRKEYHRVRNLIKSKDIQHVQKLRDASRNWRKNNPVKKAAQDARRRAAKLKATPPWLTPEHFNQMLEFYSKARELTEATGIIYEVDHIIPLQGENVCGLHVPWNLQILTKSENSRKRNKV